MKTKILKLLEDEFGKWLDKNENLIIEKIPKKSKIFPMFCGSMAEGFISRGSDLDFSVIIDDTNKERPKIKGKLSEVFVQFLDKLDKK